ncbi:MAG TPA: hypothetical protein VFH06_03810 [Candidatus Saccharimonadales bacterium]|nr:hypothetical protein [Candidatus Saccharimonadales bacterium]
MAVTRKTTKRSGKSVSAERMRSFRVYPGEKPFFTIRISQQTFYWLIICLLVLGLGVWTIFLTVRVQNIYDRVDVTTQQNNS